MTIKNTLLGGSDFSTPDARVKPTDLNDTFDILGKIANLSLGSLFNDTMQNLFNADYLGFDSRLFGSGAPNLKNTFYSTFTSDDADTSYNFIYDAINDLYITIDFSAVTEYLIVEASSFTGWTNGNNDTYAIPSGPGAWIVFCDTGSQGVQKAQIHKSMWYGTNGTDALVLDFTSITAIKTPEANDVGKRGILREFDGAVTNSAGSTADVTDTFVDTSTNLDSSLWSNITVGGTAQTSVFVQFATGTTVNTVTGAVGSSNEIGTDRVADERDNPSGAKYGASSGAGNAGGFTTDMVIICNGVLTQGTPATANGGTVTKDILVDYTTDHSIPVFTASSNADIDTSTLIFKDTASVSVDNMIPVINSTIDGANSEQISVSANSGSNYTDIDNTEIARPTAGTGIWRRIVITRTDLETEDIVTEQAVKYNIY